MKGRDLLILGAVLLVIGFAVADSLRSDEDPGRGAARPRPGPRRRADTSRPPTTENDLGREFFPTVNGAPGSIVLSQIGSCAVREFDLPTGFELPNVIQRSTCELWAAPVTAKVAVGLGQPVGDAVPFRFVDLGRPNRDLGSSEAAFGFLVWSDDGQRAAWCTRRLDGIDLELDGPRRRLVDCPAAYTPDGEIAYAMGDRLVVEDREVLQASGGITRVHYGNDDSVAVVDRGRADRALRGRPADGRARPPRPVPGAAPRAFAGQLLGRVPGGDRIRILDVGCSPYARRSVPRPCRLVVTGRRVARGRRRRRGHLRETSRPVRRSSGRSAPSQLIWRRA